MRDVHDQIRRVTPLVEADHRHGVRVSVGINQISFAPDEYVATYSAAMHEAGAPEIMLYDGGSGMGPEAYAFMVGLVCEHAPDAVVGVHTHNMFDLAVATALESVKAGARVLEVSVNGYCSASGQADLAATTMALNALYGGRVAPGDCSPEALTRSGQGDFHHPAPPLMCLVAIVPLP